MAPYPGAAELIVSPERWRRYIQDSLIETTISRGHPALDARRINRRFCAACSHLGCAYSGQILSYQKMIGQLTDAGNTVTLAHYLELLQDAGMLAGLAKYSPWSGVRRSVVPAPSCGKFEHRLDERAGPAFHHGGPTGSAIIGGESLNRASAHTCLIPVSAQTSASPIGANETAKWTSFCRRASQSSGLK